MPEGYTVGLNLDRVNVARLHAIIQDLSPNGRWYCGTIGSYKRAAQLGVRRSALAPTIAYCWNRIAYLSCKERGDKAGMKVYRHSMDLCLDSMAKADTSVCWEVPLA
jgi:hypothetical protein